MPLRLEPSFSRAGAGVHPQSPEAVGVRPRLLHAAPDAGALIGLAAETLTSEPFLEVLTGRAGIDGAVPYASVYAGHQFGHFVPQLGDGRAVTIAEVAGRDGPWEIQLKGAGRTPFSRFGDGRAVMRSTLREYLASEAMAALGIPTTRAVALAATGEGVTRESVEPGATLMRVAPSHLRFGHFEYFQHTAEAPEQVRVLADFAIDHFFPDAASASGEGRYAAFFREVVGRTADLMAAWQSVGFTHGVMNTDNMSVLGLTIDYGPYGWLDAYNPAFVPNTTDRGGRYAYQAQPQIGLWNLQALAAALVSLIGNDDLVAGLESYAPRFQQAMRTRFAAKLGLPSPDEAHAVLVGDLQQVMAAGGADMTATFRGLSDLLRGEDPGPWLSRFGEGAEDAARAWLARWRAAVDPNAAPAMDGTNPLVVPRQWICERIIRAVEDDGDLVTLDQGFSVLTQPYAAVAGGSSFYGPPPPGMAGRALSCSS